MTTTPPNSRGLAPVGSREAAVTDTPAKSVTAVGARLFGDHDAYLIERVDCGGCAPPVGVRVKLRLVAGVEYWRGRAFMAGRGK